MDRLCSGSERQTEAVGRRLAAVLEPGAVLLLDGDLGAGKTVFARGVIRGLAAAVGTDHVCDDQAYDDLSERLFVPSPTFTLVNSYIEGRIPVHHWDFYRITDPGELTETGIGDLLGVDADPPGVALIEWWQKGAFWIPDDRIRVVLGYADDDEHRTIDMTGQGPLSERILHAFQRHTRP